MKKITKFFGKIFKGIYHIIDKIIITPLSRLAYFITDKFGNRSGRFEKFLNKPNTLLYISLICAFGLFLGIDKKIINLVETEAIVLSNQTVTAEYNEEAFVIEGLPESADIVLMGKKSELYLAQQLGDHKLTADLSSVSEGTHKIALKYNNQINTLDYKLDPSTVTVVVHPKVSESRTLTTDILNTDKLNETLVISSVALDRDEVIIKSYKEKLSTVASVKAIIDVSALNSTTAGTYTLDNVKLVAYDEKGTEIKDVEIVPGTVTATIVITSPNKVVPITIVPVGDVASGSAIASITSNVTKVTLYGDEKVLSKIDEIQVEIDVSGLNENKTYQETITRPTGVRSMSSTAITVKVTMETETSKEFTDIPLVFENLDKTKYNVFAAEGEKNKVDVVVRGVSTVLDKLKVEDIKAYLDLSELGEGEYDVPVMVTGTDLRLNYSSKTTKIKVNISKIK